MSHPPIPKFASEEEDASWWGAHPEILTERFQTARQQGQVRRLSPSGKSDFKLGGESHLRARRCQILKQPELLGIFQV